MTSAPAEPTTFSRLVALDSDMLRPPPTFCAAVLPRLMATAPPVKFEKSRVSAPPPSLSTTLMFPAVAPEKAYQSSPAPPTRLAVTPVPPTYGLSSPPRPLNDAMMLFPVLTNTYVEAPPLKLIPVTLLP